MSIRGKCAAKGCGKACPIGTASCCDECARAIRRAWRLRKQAQVARKVNPPVCDWTGCEVSSLPGKKHCSDEHRRAIIAARQATWKAAKTAERTEARPSKEKPVGDTFYCQGCRFMKSCQASERGVQCLAMGGWKRCQPWTGSPLLKVAR